MVSILGVTVNSTALSTAQEFAHVITFGLTLALLTGIAQFVYHKVRPIGFLNMTCRSASGAHALITTDGAPSIYVPWQSRL